MMQVYLNAIHESKTGPNQYVLQKSLDIFRTGDKQSVIAHLSSGYNINAVCINGVMEETWKIGTELQDLQKHLAFQQISKILGGDHNEKGLMTINVQEIYETSGKREAIWMYVDIWKLSSPKPQTIWVTPKDKTACLSEYDAGQKKADDIIEILKRLNIKQDKNAVIETLRRQLKNMN